MSNDDYMKASDIFKESGNIFSGKVSFEKAFPQKCKKVK